MTKPNKELNLTEVFQRVKEIEIALKVGQEVIRVFKESEDTHKKHEKEMLKLLARKLK